ncbi:MAG: hypothetical protein GEU28_09515 [Dehalococcoidia bacterium]|nr:hypothetical protein [Dehalococcoidia bacterium]
MAWEQGSIGANTPAADIPGAPPPVFPVLIGKDPSRLLPDESEYGPGRRQLRYDFPGLQEGDRNALLTHIASGNSLDPVNLLFWGRTTIARLDAVRAALRRAGWGMTRMGSPQTATFHALVHSRMRWQLQKPLDGGAEVPEALRPILAGFLNGAMPWRYRLHVRISSVYRAGGDWGSVAVGGAHIEVVPALSPAGRRMLRRAGLTPGELTGWFLHHVIDWNRAREDLQNDLASAGYVPALWSWPHGGVYQDIPFDGLVCCVRL